MRVNMETTSQIERPFFTNNECKPLSWKNCHIETIVEKYMNASNSWMEMIGGNCVENRATKGSYFQIEVSALFSVDSKVRVMAKCQTTILILLLLSVWVRQEEKKKKKRRREENSVVLLNGTKLMYAMRKLGPHLNSTKITAITLTAVQVYRVLLYYVTAILNSA